MWCVSKNKNMHYSASFSQKKQLHCEPPQIFLLGYIIEDTCVLEFNKDIVWWIQLLGGLPLYDFFWQWITALLKMILSKWPLFFPFFCEKFFSSVSILGPVGVASWVYRSKFWPWEALFIHRNIKALCVTILFFAVIVWGHACSSFF